MRPSGLILGWCLCVNDERRRRTPSWLSTGLPRSPRIVGPLLECATWIAGRYMGAQRAEEYGQRNAQPGELLVRITPNHVVAHADLAD